MLNIYITKKENVLPKDFIERFNKILNRNLWENINKIMFLVEDKLIGQRNKDFNEMVSFLDYDYDEVFDNKILNKAIFFFEKEIEIKGEEKFFKEIFQEIKISEKCFIENEIFLNDFFILERENGYSGWGENQYPSSKLSSYYRLDFKKFKNFAWRLKLNIYYKILEENPKNEVFLEFVTLNLRLDELSEIEDYILPKGNLNLIKTSREERVDTLNSMKNISIPVNEKVFNKYKSFFKKYFTVNNYFSSSSHDGNKFNIESKSVLLSLK